MKGFFSREETQSTSRPDGKVYSCAACKLYKNAESPKMKPFGNFKKHILNIGEAPGEVEDERGKQWQGKTGRLLKRTYKKFGIDLFEDCLNINAVNCHPEENKNPTNFQIDCCWTVLLSKIIKEYQPKLIMLFGNAALQSFLGHRWKQDLNTITKWRGWTIPDQDFKAWICPTFHPSYISREDREVNTVWCQDIERALEKLDTPVYRWTKPNIKIIEDLSPLESLPSLVSIDFETTGLKPQAAGHRIVCASVAYDENNCYTFIIPKTKRERQPLINMLANKQLGKMAHNMKFEQVWSTVRLRQEIKNWEWDSMIAAHVLDNRTGVTNLKFQTYVNFGIIDYSSEVAPYLKGTDKSANSFNQIIKLIETKDGQNKLLEYCGMDTITQYRLALKQMDELGHDFLPF